MYNSYKAKITVSKNTLAIAKSQVATGAMSSSYELLTASYYNKENKKTLEIIEPAAGYKMAVTNKANNLKERVHGLKTGLEGSFYVLSPLMGRKIGSL